MAQQIIDTGNGGDNIGEAFTITNSNFTELYSRGDDLTFVLPGTAAVDTGLDVVVTSAFTVTDMEAYAATAPQNTGGSGSALVMVLKRNGTTVHTITFNHNATTTTASSLSVAFARGDRYRIDVTQIGDNTPGGGVSVAYRRVYA